jgi:hypothetical protein
MSYTNVLQYINQNPDANSKEVAEIIIDDYYNGLTGSHSYIYFGIYMDKIQNIIDEFNQLLIHLINDLPSKIQLIELNIFSNIYDVPPEYPYSNDIYRFCSKLKKIIKNQQIEILSDNVIKFIDAAVIRPVEDDGPIPDRTKGISIYYPPNSEDYLDEYLHYNYREYEKLDFAKDTLWDEFLRDVFSKSKTKLYFSTPFLTFFDNHPNLFSLIRQILGL